MTALTDPATASGTNIQNTELPFALLTLPKDAATGTARRTAGMRTGTGTLTIAGTSIQAEGIGAGHQRALAGAVKLLPGALDGTYALTFHAGHRALVEATAEGIALDTCEFADDKLDGALALAWVAALLTLRAGDPRPALRQVMLLYRQMSASEQQTLQAALADGQCDAGNLAAIMFERAVGETVEEELERWESWFLGQRRIDLPYNRRAVIDILASDIDPDEKRLLIHDSVQHFDLALERENIARIVSEVRAARQELIFGRMSRAFHNQSLLFANSQYVRIDGAVRERMAELILACADLALLAPAADRLRALLQGADETAMVSALGAVELLEDAILDDQRQAVERVLKAERNNRPLTDALTPNAVLARTESLLDLSAALRAALRSAPRRPAAYVILSQRIFPLETHLLARINELQEPYLGKPDDLKILVRQGGHRTYSSPEYAWLQQADHWVEAIPLFIKEQILVVDGVEVTETVIDQQAMEETFREQFADHWAQNINNVMDTEQVALARELLALNDERLAGDDRARAAAVKAYGLTEGVSALAAMITEGYRAHADVVHLRAEQDDLQRYEAMRAILLENIRNDHPVCLAAAMHRNATANGTTYLDEAIALLATRDEWVRAEAKRLEKIADQPRRPLPCLNVLTTQSARMSDGYVRTWLEESMALGNVIRAHELDEEVKARMADYRRQITGLGTQLIRELGMWAEVEELMALENLPEPVAVMRIIFGNAVIARQVALLAILKEHDKLPEGKESPLVEALLVSHARELQAEALRAVYARNELELLPKMDAYRAEHTEVSEEDAIRALILGNPEYADDLAAFTRFAARDEAIRELDRRDSTLMLAARVRDWLRNHSRLALTTARREVLLAHNLNHLTLHPLFYYRAAGGNKRYHQLYTPSRVDLGTHERESVEKWSQWVGGADRAAARAGRRVFGLINKNVKMFDSLCEPEVLKTGENASRVAHLSYSNALGLLINSIGRGDVEELADQMNLRKDRYVTPGGEGYGGYCVPKDGLFLEFVLILTRATKLRQLAIPDHLHSGVVKFAHDLLAKRADFTTDIAWEAWAMKALAERTEVAGYFSVRDGAEGPLPVFQITRIARALTQLGRPELTDAFDVLANLAARWGIHKVIVGGEQVNRFMAFYKTWLTYQAIGDAKRLNPDVPIAGEDFSVVLSAEYKPDTQDGRFSVGMRKYEIFAGTSEHLTYSLDVPGQDLVHLMFHGFDSLWQNRTDPRLRARLTRLLQELEVREDDREGVEQLRSLFPGVRPPAEIRMVSPMKLTTADLLHYTSDTTLEHRAQEAQRRLMHIGLTENEITANMQVYGPRLARWTKVRDLPAAQREALVSRIGGDIHALAMSVIGPAGNYEMAVQGADVLDTGIPHTTLLALLADPVKLRDLMLAGNPYSALVIVDGASGARHRALNRLAVKRWFAAGEAINRQSMYRCAGIGAETIESWRTEMRRERARAKLLFEAVTDGRMTEAAECYVEIGGDLREGQETIVQLEQEERLLRQKTPSQVESAQSRALSAVAAGLPLAQLNFAAWLALGGQFWLMGRSAKECAEIRQTFEQAIARLNGKLQPADEETVTTLLCSAFVPAVEEFREEKGIESSNKATEEVAAVAIETRQRLAVRAARAKALRECEQAFHAALSEPSLVARSVEQLVAEARTALGDGASMSQKAFGRVQAITRLAFLALGNELFADDAPHQRLLVEHIEKLFTGGAFDPIDLRAIIGGYEDPGDIARLAQSVAEAHGEGRITAEERDSRLARVADIAELFDCCRAIALTIDFFTVESEPMLVWRAMADFFAESLNDHFYEYRPWAYSRGIGFAHLEGDTLYALAVEHHRWLYRYLRQVVLHCTELQNWTAVDIAELVGDMETAGERPPIGADAESADERRWRAYSQLRELAFIRNDGFALPQVFPAFDPAIINADTRTNMAFLYPAGRTHVSRALMEGPTLTQEMEADGHPGVNVLITRDANISELPESTRPVLQLLNAQLYISRDEYLTALMQYRGLSREAAEALASEQAGPKGIRIAARFTHPLTVAMVMPFHGNPKYESGKLEELGLPYSCQSRFHTWTTYDKAKYPDIFCPETGVELPGEIDWLAAWTQALGAGATKQALEHGDPSHNYPGLRAFAQRYPRIMVKDAAESGGRGQKAFTVLHTDSTVDDTAIADAVEFIYGITQKHNVAIQEVIISSPESWATEEFLQSFVDRQVQDWGVAVNRTRRPRTPLFGSHRLVFSTGDPRTDNWHISHMITLNSRQLITNVGRGGTLDIFRPEIIRPEFREKLLARMQESGEKTMAALARYGAIGEAQYREESGQEIGADATGLSYATPRYMMLDFLVQPIFAEEGLLIDLEPVYDQQGQRVGADFILQRGEERIHGTVKDWRVVLIEPNIGIGLWDRLAIREEFYAVRATAQPDWHTVGANARIVLRDFARAGEGYLAAIKK